MFVLGHHCQQSDVLTFRIIVELLVVQTDNKSFKMIQFASLEINTRIGSESEVKRQGMTISPVGYSQCRAPDNERHRAFLKK